MAASTLLFAQEAHEREGIDLILPALPELIWGAICFALVFLILSKVAFPRLGEAIKARENAIRGNLEQSEAAKKEAQRTLDEYKRQLAEARGDVNRIIEESRQQAEQVRKDIIARAESDAQQIVERAQEQLLAERNRTIQELQGTISELSLDLAEKVVGRSIDPSTQRDLVDAYIRDVTSMPSPDGNGSRV
jgi:F-type H+-transporting ATPase subunit b